MVDTPKKGKPRLFLFDAYALIYRAFYALIQRPLISTRGENTSAAYGFTRFLLKVQNNYEPDYLGIVVDAGNSQRQERYPAYKATREKMPEELRAGLHRIWDIIDGFRVPIISVDALDSAALTPTQSRIRARGSRIARLGIPARSRSAARERLGRYRRLSGTR